MKIILYFQTNFFNSVAIAWSRRTAFTTSHSEFFSTVKKYSFKSSS